MAPMKPQPLTLSMIVKNESRVIKRCLESVKPLITSWVIVDTGSTDGTQAIIRECMKELPGELHERPWKDFAANRNEALELAKSFGDYVLVIDADDTLEWTSGWTMPELKADAYQLLIRYNGTAYYRTQIFRSSLDFAYAGVLHEVLLSASARSEERLPGLVYRIQSEGARSADPNKYRNDAEVLERALRNEPGNARYGFYLAQSWRDAGELEKAREAYRAAAGMGGWVEEVWYSHLEIARLTARLGDREPDVVAAYLKAYELRPSRAEPLSYLAQYLREHDRVVAGYPFARVAAETPRPLDRLFIDESVYAWRALDEFAVAGYWVGNYQGALEANRRLLEGDRLPISHRSRVLANLAFCESKLGMK